MSKELAKTYDPKGIEERLYQKWMDNGYFHAKVNPDKKPFTIVMPPPNVTGQLHMGHALDETMQDILIRFKRMQGYEALWQPGTDHAAIATEVKKKKKLKAEGIDKAERLIEFGGLGHSAVIHSEDRETVLKFSNTMKAGIIIVNSGILIGLCQNAVIGDEHSPRFGTPECVEAQLPQPRFRR